MKKILLLIVAFSIAPMAALAGSKGYGHYGHGHGHYTYVCPQGATTAYYHGRKVCIMPKSHVTHHRPRHHYTPHHHKPHHHGHKVYKHYKW